MRKFFNLCKEFCFTNIWESHTWIDWHCAGKGLKTTLLFGVFSPLSSVWVDIGVAHMINACTSSNNVAEISYIIYREIQWFCKEFCFTNIWESHTWIDWHCRKGPQNHSIVWCLLLPSFFCLGRHWSHLHDKCLYIQ